MIVVNIISDMKVLLESGTIEIIPGPEFPSPPNSDHGSPSPISSPSSGFESDLSGPDSPLMKEDSPSK